MSEQLDLFRRERPMLETVACTACGRTIVTQDFRLAGYVSSEYQDKDGRCFTCAYPKKKKRRPE